MPLQALNVACGKFIVSWGHVNKDLWIALKSFSQTAYGFDPNWTRRAAKSSRCFNPLLIKALRETETHQQQECTSVHFFRKNEPA
jgi:hypothetical protein